MSGIIGDGGWGGGGDVHVQLLCFRAIQSTLAITGYQNPVPPVRHNKGSAIARSVIERVDCIQNPNLDKQL